MTDREALPDRALEVPGVVSVQEIATGTNNVSLNAIAEGSDDLTRIVLELAEVGLDVVDEHLVRRGQSSSFSGFAVDGTEG